jgi:hypothetical protein
VNYTSDRPSGIKNYSHKNIYKLKEILSTPKQQKFGKKTVAQIDKMPKKE